CREPLIECAGHAPNLTQLDELPAGFDELRLSNLAQQEDLRIFEAAAFGAAGNSSSQKFMSRLRAFAVTNSSTLNLDYFVAWHKRLPNLRALNVSYSDLETLKNLGAGISVLDAGYNRIHTVALGMPDLTWLSLAGNRISFIKPSSMAELKKLEYLDLSDNELLVLAEIFDPLQALQRLNLAGNKLLHVKPDWFRNLGRLVELDVSRNRLTFIPADTLRPLTSLAVFKLAENPLIERDLSLLLGTGRRLEIVDASRIGLLRVPAALTRSVRTLKLSGNQLTSVMSGDLDSYPLLTVLDLSANCLRIIEDDALGRLEMLQELILTGNILPTIPKSLPSRLRIFDLRQNAISKLRANDLQGLYYLKELNLSGNVIDSIEEGSFRLLPNLEVLDISDNPIKLLPSDNLSGPSKLLTLRMSGLMSLTIAENQNRDTAFPILALERLVTLDVSRSPALAEQLLADNAALSACKCLQELNLSYTNISSMRSDLAYVLPMLEKLNLIGNEWNCSTDQFWLGKWTVQHRKTSGDISTRCTTPCEFEGKLLEELPQPREIETITRRLAEVSTSTSTPETRTNSVANGIASTRGLAESPRTTTTVSSIQSTTDNLSITSTTSASTFKTTTTTKSPKISKAEAQELQMPPSTTQKNAETVSETSTSTTIMNFEQPKPTVAPSTIGKLVHVNQATETVPTTSSLKPMASTISNDMKVTRKVFSTITIPRETSPTTATTTTTTTTYVPPTASPIRDSTTRVSFVQPKQPVETIKIEASEIIPTINDEKLVFDAGLFNVGKKSVNRVVSDFSRSKLLLANEDPSSRVLLANANNAVDSSNTGIAEELNGQATESGARTSEATTIGAAAALTVVLSRRATVKRRDQRLYQRHENIEVHALTPTTELW
ncbi:hypothetical protein TSAR_009911, partial [Trichomalopsis sarcophagae]